MPLNIPKIEFDLNGKTLVVEIDFLKTRKLVHYSLTLKEAGSNTVVFKRTGDNSNDKDDVYPLADPPSTEHKRSLLFDATFIDLEGEQNTLCRAEAVVKQGASVRGKLVVEGVMVGSSYSGADFAKLIAKA